MINLKRFFLRINADDDAIALGENDALNVENMRMGADEFGKNYQQRNVPSTQVLFSGLPSGNNLTLGRISDIGKLREIWFNYNSNGNHGIYCYDFYAKTTYIVLLSSQAEKGLNFSKSFRISRNARIVGSLLFYTDNNNEPQCVNIEAGIKLNQPTYVTYVEPYLTPIPYETLTLIKRPPIYPLGMTKLFDGGFLNNFIQNNAYQFSYYYVYKNYQQSVLSAFSELAPYNADGEDSNYILLKVPFVEQIPDYVLQVVLCVRYGNFGKSFIVKTFSKSNTYDNIAIASHNAGSVQLSYSFYDNTIGIALDIITANTSFDDVALKAKTLESAKNRFFLGNVLKGYNSPNYTSLQAALTNVDTGTGGSFDGTWGYMILHANWGSIGGCQDSYMYPFVYSTTAPHKYYYFPAVRQNSAWNGGTYIPDLTSSETISDATIVVDTEADFINNLKFLVSPYSPTCTVGSPTWQVAYEANYNFSGTSIPTTLIDFEPVSVTHFFKSNSVYEINIEFKDRFNRKCGVVNDGVYLSTPPRTYAQTTFTTAIQWSLSNSNALNQIPDWAYYYQIVIKKNQTTRFFLQIRAAGVQYVTKNQDGTFTYGDTYTFGTTYALGIDIGALTNYGLGYTFTDGDEARLIQSDETVSNLNVIGQDGNYVWLTPTDLGSGSATTIVLLELFTPYKAEITEPYFEVPVVYSILNPSTNIRTFSTLSDVINGDTYAIERQDSTPDDYIVEAMSPNDKEWQIWQTDTGFTNFIDTIGQQQKETSIDYSDTYINGTKINGLNKFEPLNTKDIGNSSGSIQKIQLTNKQQEDGTVMLVITEGDCLSAYLSEVQLVAAAQNDSSPIQSTDVIGTINALKNGYGTLNPESVVEYNGVVWWLDVVHGIVAQYAQDGVTVVSDYGVKRFFDIFSKRYLILGSLGIEALCGFSYIESCVDVSTDEVLFTLPQSEPDSFVSILPSYLIGTGIWKYALLYYTTDGTTPIPINVYYILLEDTTAYYAEIYQNPITLPLFVNFSDVTAVGFSEAALVEYILAFLPAPDGTWVNSQTPTYFVVPNKAVNLFNATGATSIQNRFDIYDGQPKTFSYKYLENKWQNVYQWLPDCMDYLGSKLIGFKAGSCYLHNESTTSFNVIYSVPYPQRLCFALNGLSASALKDLFDIAIEANAIPNFVVGYADYPNVQITDLTADDFTTIQGIQFARFFMDRLSPNATGTPDEKLYKGDVLSDVTPFIMLEFQEYTQPLIIKFVNIGFEISYGLSQIDGTKIKKP